jgi:hypothetical protein
MNLQQFVQNDNIEMLWDVISDEDIFKYLSQNIQYNIQQLFISNVKSFYENEKTTTNTLKDLNKKYILLILNHIKTTYPYKPTKIKIHDEENKQNQLNPINPMNPMNPMNINSQNEFITFEEIQNDRQNKFDKEYNKKQQEFENSMTIQKPPVPEFSDKDSDGPIKEMDKIIEQMQKQRNYEIEEFNRTYNSNVQTNNWLTPQETSLKNEKLNFDDNANDKNANNNNKKTVSFDNNDKINIYETPETNIQDNIHIQIHNDEEDMNIFSKLKMKTMDTNTTTEHKKEDKIIQLERKINKLDEKMDKILELISLFNNT